MQLINNLMAVIAIFSSQKPATKVNTRIIYLGDGRKVEAPAKPDRVLVSYSIIPICDNMTMEDWHFYIMYRREDEDLKTRKVFYL
jgi:hypothetical protein